MVLNMQSLLIVGIIASLSCSALAITCYQCESLGTDKCGANFDPEGVYKADCSKSQMPRFMQTLFDFRTKNATGCMKTTFEVQGVRHTTRSCFFGDLNNKAIGCSTDPTMLSTAISCDVCTDNLCNSSSVAGPIAIVVGIMAIIGRMLF